MHTSLITATSLLAASALGLALAPPAGETALTPNPSPETETETAPTPVTVTVDGVTVHAGAPATGTTTVTLPDGRVVTVTVDGPAPPAAREVYEIVFVLDTTGSMGGLIEGAKQRIWTIASHAQQRTPKPEVRIGLVAYRDRQDGYTTRVTPLSADIDAVYRDLMSFRAAGGGDTPESVNEALDVAFSQTGWSEGENVRRIVYLVGDAPPKDYDDDTDYQTSVPRAHAMGVTVHAIQCGNVSGTEYEWRAIAQLGGGAYAAVDQDGGATVVPTPFDKELADLNRELTATIVPYGEAAVAARAVAQTAVAMELDDAAPPAALAARAVFRADNEMEMIGAGDLVTQIDNGVTTLDAFDPDQVRGDLAGRDARETRAAVATLLERRRAAERRIAELSAERGAWLAENADAIGAGSGFDAFIARTLSDEGSDTGSDEGAAESGAE